MTITVEHCGHVELPLLVVRWGDREATFAPTHGGRLLGLALAERQLLWANPRLVDRALSPLVPLAGWPRGSCGMADWPNLGGSKTWPAPQGWSSPDQWAGPPDKVLDQGPWRLEITHIDGGVSVHLESAFDERTGLVIRKRFDFGDAEDGFTETIDFQNAGGRAVRWAPWEVCQVDTETSATNGGVVRVRGVRAGGIRELGTWEGQIETHLRDGEVIVPLGTGVAKRGFDAPDGTLEYRRFDGYGVRLGAIDPPLNGPYPDEGSSLEVWLQRPIPEPIAALDELQPDAHLVELEVLGPLTILTPGARCSSRIRWELMRPAER